MGMYGWKFGMNTRKDDDMHEIDELMLLKDLSELSPIEYCIWYTHRRGRHISKSEAKQAAAEYAALVEELKNRREMNAYDGFVLIECMKLLGMDVSGAATTDIPKVLAAALDRGKG